MATTSERTAEVQALLSRSFEALVAELAQGRSERLERYLRFTARFYRYSPQNQALIFEQMPDVTRVAGYRTWQKLGYQVYYFVTSRATGVLYIVYIHGSLACKSARLLSGQCRRRLPVVGRVPTPAPVQRAAYSLIDPSTPSPPVQARWVIP
jgi:hypothetical protein